MGLLSFRQSSSDLQSVPRAFPNRSNGRISYPGQSIGIQDEAELSDQKDLVGQGLSSWRYDILWWSQPLRCFQSSLNY